MDRISQGYEQLINNFVRWAQTQEDIRLAFVVGSRARSDHPADVWSDLDLAVVARDIRPYIERADWINQVGKPWLTFIERTGDGSSVERRELFDGGWDVDFALMPLAMILAMFEKGLILALRMFSAGECVWCWIKTTCFPIQANMLPPGSRLSHPVKGNSCRLSMTSGTMPSGAPSMCGGASCGGGRPAVMTG